MSIEVLVVFISVLRCGSTSKFFLCDLSNLLRKSSCRADGVAANEPEYHLAVNILLKDDLTILVYKHDVSHDFGLAETRTEHVTLRPTSCLILCNDTRQAERGHG